MVRIKQPNIGIQANLGREKYIAKSGAKPIVVNRQREFGKVKEEYWDNLARIDLAKSTMDFMTVRKEPIQKPRSVFRCSPKKVKHSLEVPA